MMNRSYFTRWPGIMIPKMGYGKASNAGEWSDMYDKLLAVVWVEAGRDGRE